MYILYHCVLEMYNLLFCFFRGVTIMRLPLSSEETLTLNYVKSKKRL